MRPDRREAVPCPSSQAASAPKRRRGTTAPARSVIEVRDGRLTDIVDDAETALLSGPATIYQRGGVLVHAVKIDTVLDDDDPSRVRRATGATVLVPASALWLVEQMGRSALWVRRTGGKKLTPIDPPQKYAQTLLSRGQWRFPVLRGIVTAPTLARDGRVIEAPGFDAVSGLLLDFAPAAFPPIPTTPTKDEARAALDCLARPLRGFPFARDADRSVALSALLTALIRPSLRTAPLLGFDAPTAGTGKSLLAEMVGLLATGVRPAALSQGKSAEEDEKRLSTVLFAGDPVIHIDNCEQALSGDFLCSMLTQEIVQARILGRSERRVLPSTALVLASGNNLTLAGDAARRAVVCRLDAGMERPDARAFDFDCHAEVLASRPALVIAALTILRAYRLAQQSEDGVALTPMGSFADWAWIRGALVWLGWADPADTRTAIFDSDPRTEELSEVMALWEAMFGFDEPVEVGKINARAIGVAGGPAEVLRDKFNEVTGCDTWNARRVGWWLRRHKDRVVGGRCFRCDHSGRLQIWRLARSQPFRDAAVSGEP